MEFTTTPTREWLAYKRDIVGPPETKRQAEHELDLSGGEPPTTLTDPAMNSMRDQPSLDRFCCQLFEVLLDRGEVPAAALNAPSHQIVTLGVIPWHSHDRRFVQFDREATSEEGAKLMESSSLEFFKKLLSAPGPSGYERPVQDVVRDYAADFADQIETDSHGNVMMSVQAESTPTVMLAGHCDQIGMLVSYIDDDGFLYAQTIGGWDPQQLVGQRMTVWTADGPLAAVISRKPIHLLTDDERKVVVKERELWLDIGAKSKSEAENYVRIGDPVTLELGFQPLLNGRANAPAMDNRTGVWAVTEALRRSRQHESMSCRAVAVSTVQEEIGLRGAMTSAFRVRPDVGIAVDVTHATDCPTIDKKQQGDIKLGRGPVIFRGPNMNPHVTERLCQLASDHKIPFQLSALGRAAPNDSNSLQISRSGVATGLVAVPNRYMHSAVETISLDDLDATADLLAHFISSLDAADDFTP